MKKKINISLIVPEEIIDDAQLVPLGNPSETCHLYRIEYAHEMYSKKIFKLHYKRCSFCNLCLQFPNLFQA